MSRSYRRTQEYEEKIEAGIALYKMGEPPKNYVVSGQDKVAEPKYIIARMVML